MTDLAAATEAYAAYRNALVTYEGIDSDVLEHLQEDCDKAKKEMEIAFINHTTGGTS